MRISTALSAILAVTLIACSDSTTPSSLAGTYALLSVEGVLPYELSDDGTTVSEITAGSLTLTAAGTFTSSFAIRETTSSGTTTFNDGGSGTYTVSQNTLTLTTPNEPPITAMVSGNTITAVITGLTAVFRK